MSQISTFGRAVSQLATPSVSSNTCRSCQLRLSAASQQRQFQTSTARPAFTDRFKALISGKKKSKDSTSVSKTGSKKLENIPRKADYPGWTLPLERKLPEGWAKTAKEDKAYVMASEGKDLEHVGSDKWIEQQFDDKPKYKGWKKVQNSTGMTPKDAEARILKIATEAGLQVESTGLDSVIDPKKKFEFTNMLRASTRMRIPDIVMHRATTLKDFQQAILSKPKPKKLSFALLANEELLANRNVQVRGGRQTPVHKDRAVGRWKLIENELVNRGLPVFGHGVKADRGFKTESV